ncbi:LamG domain-containing protein [Actinoplanes sp. NPDC051859]|uniref:LamG domain-containing protein n=1 Tax=Actinoplanes sp. NPDC051859 TaxID=3363909 RepID=UPI0037920143
MTEAPGGGVIVSGPNGVIVGAPPAVAWDSTVKPPIRKDSAAQGQANVKSAQRALSQAGDPPPVAASTSSAEAPGDLARIADVDVAVAGKELTVKVDDTLLDGRSSFPLFIDPTFDKVYEKWIPVSARAKNEKWTSGDSWPRGDIRVGENYDDAGDLWRAHVQFDIGQLAGKVLINTTSVDATEVHTGHCRGEKVSLWQTNKIDGNTPSWNGMADKWLHGAALDTVTSAANAGCGEKPGGIKFKASGVKTQVQRHATAKMASITFGLRVPDEDYGHQHWVRLKAGSVRLIAEYRSTPTSPVAVRSAPGGDCKKEAPGPWINDNSPTLYGKASDDDGEVRIVFDLTGPTSPADYKSPKVKTKPLPQEADWTPSGLADGNYRWRVHGTDDVEGSPWTDYYCHFRLDQTRPATPLVRRVSAGSPKEGQPVTLEFSSWDAGSGISKFGYGIGVDVWQHTVDSNGTTQITFTPPAGRTQVSVWARDAAGNNSERADFNFFTGRIVAAQSKAVWRLTADPRDDSGNGQNLQFSGDVGYGPDRTGQDWSALSLTGNGCANATSVVRSDAEFTVTAWANVTDKSQARPVLAIHGDHIARFVLFYDSRADSWKASLTSRDSSDPQWFEAPGPQGVPLNTWQHLAATVDPVARVMRIYVDGVLKGETAISDTPWNGEKFQVGCAGGNRMHGRVDNVGVWQGLLDDGQIWEARTELPSGPAGAWQLRGDGGNTVAAENPLDVPQTASWTEDAFGRPRSAIELDGNSCAPAKMSVVKTDESFTMATWVKITDTGGGYQTVLGQDGSQVGNWHLGARNDGRWTLHVKDADTMMSPARDAYSPPNAVHESVGRWTHLAAVYRATAKRIALFVNGKLVDEVESGPTPWHASGQLTVGCGKWGEGHSHFLRGAIADVRLWRGALSNEAMAALPGSNPPVAVQGLWPLEGDGSEEPTNFEDRSGHGRHLSVAGQHEWLPDRFESRGGALGLALAEGSCAQTTGPVIRTDESFSVSAWVAIDELTGTRTVLSQLGAGTQGFRMEYAQQPNRWRFVMPSRDDNSAAVVEVQSKAEPVRGVWTLLSAVYDLPAKKIRFYVNGDLQGEQNAPGSPWTAQGPVTVGCTGTTDGRRTNHLGGLVDDVRVWSSTVHPDRFASLAHS